MSNKVNSDTVCLFQFLEVWALLFHLRWRTAHQYFGLLWSGAAVQQLLTVIPPSLKERFEPPAVSFY